MTSFEWKLRTMDINQLLQCLSSAQEIPGQVWNSQGYYSELSIKLSTLCAKSSAPELFPLAIWLLADRCGIWLLVSDHKLSFPDVRQAFTNWNLSDVEIATKACPARAFTQTNMMISVSGCDTLKAKEAKKSSLWAHLGNHQYRFELFQQSNYL